MVVSWRSNGGYIVEKCWKWWFNVDLMEISIVNSGCIGENCEIPSGSQRCLAGKCCIDFSSKPSFLMQILHCHHVNTGWKSR